MSEVSVVLAWEDWYIFKESSCRESMLSKHEGATTLRCLIFIPSPLALMSSRLHDEAFHSIFSAIEPSMMACGLGVNSI
jgi:hypothetical protein